MLTRIVASAVIASLFLLPIAQAQQPPRTITVPAGTVIPLTLVNPIKSKSTHPGDIIRASIAFPVTVGDQVAIPAGAYVEGVLGQPLPKVKHQPDPGVQVHFTRLVFANGYTTPLDAMQAATLPPVLPAKPSPVPTSMALLATINPNNAIASWGLSHVLSLLSEWKSGQIWLMALQAALPPLAPLPKTGPSPGILIGAGLGATAALVIVGILFHHRSGNSDFIVHDAGWQFQMKLDAPISIDTSQIGTQIP